MSSVLGITLAKPVQGKADQTSSPSTTKVKAATSGATSEVSSISTITANSATNVSSATHQFSTATTTSQQASSATSNISTTTASKQISKSTTGKLNSNETATTSNSAATSVASTAPYIPAKSNVSFTDNIKSTIANTPTTVAAPAIPSHSTQFIDDSAPITSPTPVTTNSIHVRPFTVHSSFSFKPGQFLRFTLPNVALLRDDVEQGVPNYVKNFFIAIKPGAMIGWSQYHILPSISGAQALLESGWGKSTLSVQGHNLFGIKGSYHGHSIEMPTTEYLNGEDVTIEATFRKYPDWATSIVDHGAFLNQNSRYRNLLGVKNYSTVAWDLQNDGYATAPNYATSLINAIQDYDLQEWDQEAFTGNTGSTTTTTGNHRSGTYTFIQNSNIRTEPSLFAPIIGVYYLGDVVNYTGQIKAEGYTWLQYLASTGAIHYVALPSTVSIPSTSTYTPTNPMRNVSGTYTFTENTNIRTAPSLSAPVVGTYYPGDSVTYTGQVNAEGYIWLQYLSGSGNTRYVAMSGTSEQYNTNNISGTFTFTQQTNIRTAPSTSASIVGVYYPGDSVIYNAQITADGYTWLQYISGSGTLRYAVM